MSFAADRICLSPPLTPLPLWVRNTSLNTLSSGDIREFPNPQFHRFIISVNGEGALWHEDHHGGHWVHLKPHHLGVWPAGMQPKQVKASSPQWCFRVITLDGELAPALMNSLGYDHCSQLSLSFEHREQLEILCSLLSRDPVPHEEISSATYAFLLSLDRPSSRPLPEQICQAQEYIHQHLTQRSLTVETLAHSLSMNRYTLSRAFKTALGITPITYIVRKRLDLAQHLLSSTDESVATIARRCAFSDTPHFSRLFKKYMGITPKDARNEAHHR